MTERVLTDEPSRRHARLTRNRQWHFMERVAVAHPLWFCVWNKQGLPEGRDEWRDGLIAGMDIARWLQTHAEWFLCGEWEESRYAFPVTLTAAGLQALTERHLYDMEPVHGGLVEPGYVVTPLPA